MNHSSTLLTAGNFCASNVPALQCRMICRRDMTMPAAMILPRVLEGSLCGGRRDVSRHDQTCRACRSVAGERSAALRVIPTLAGGLTRSVKRFWRSHWQRIGERWNVGAFATHMLPKTQ